MNLALYYFFWRENRLPRTEHLIFCESKRNQNKQELQIQENQKFARVSFYEFTRVFSKVFHELSIEYCRSVGKFVKGFQCVFRKRSLLYWSHCTSRQNMHFKLKFKPNLNLESVSQLYFFYRYLKVNSSFK